jgi:hypothetical protein
MASTSSSSTNQAPNHESFNAISFALKSLALITLVEISVLSTRPGGLMLKDNIFSITAPHSGKAPVISTDSQKTTNGKVIVDTLSPH